MVYINGRKANLGLDYMHGHREVKVNADDWAEKFNLKEKEEYELKIFHAERHSTGSSLVFSCNRPQRASQRLTDEQKTTYISTHGLYLFESLPEEIKLDAIVRDFPRSH